MKTNSGAGTDAKVVIPKLKLSPPPSYKAVVYSASRGKLTIPKLLLNYS